MMTQTLPGQKGTECVACSLTSLGPFDPHGFVQTLFNSLGKFLIPLWSSLELNQLPSSFVASLTIATKSLLDQEAQPKKAVAAVPIVLNSY